MLDVTLALDKVAFKGADEILVHVDIAVFRFWEGIIIINFSFPNNVTTTILKICGITTSPLNNITILRHHSMHGHCIGILVTTTCTGLHVMKSSHDITLLHDIAIGHPRANTGPNSHIITITIITVSDLTKNTQGAIIINHKAVGFLAGSFKVIGSTDRGIDRVLIPDLNLEGAIIQSSRVIALVAKSSCRPYLAKLNIPIKI
mmetsp:Transcript_29657/g.54310  ORF Transcript_29657/g.54310 Transcript_29657/m.54310 type:complete len:203 (+) Transcript_29657:344-952(+)